MKSTENNFIFDVDGTLTPSRRQIDKNFKEFFLTFCQNNSVFLVTGSDYQKTVEQVGEEIVLAAKRIYNCSGNDVWENGKNIKSSNWKLPEDALAWLTDTLSSSKFVLRTGNHIEERPGSVNFSIVGRNATLGERELYKEYDNKFKERESLSNEFNQIFKDLESRIGGETGIDIYQKGFDKSQIVDDFDKTDKLYFFGDRMDKGGNDYPLGQRIEKEKRGLAVSVNNWQNTHEILNYYQEAKIAK